jgi:hypothetical protein
MTALPKDAASRKRIPLATGLLDYFPDACAAVAHLSMVANAQHNPGEPLHWAREKSTDHDDCLLRHFLERGTVDSDGIAHRAKVAWRALAALQLECEGRKRPAANPPKRTYPQPNDWHVSAGIRVESAYLASFGPNVKQHRRVADADELRAAGIGTVEPRHPIMAEVDRIIGTELHPLAGPESRL